MAQELLENFHIIALDGAELFYYDYLSGIYSPFEPVVKKFVQDKLGEASRIRHVNEITGFLKNHSYKEAIKLEPPKYLIPLENGVWNLDIQRLEPFDPQNFFTYKLPVKLEPGKQCPKIQEFLDQVVSKEDKEIILNLAAYLLYRDYPIQKAFFFVGGGGNGKTTLINTLGTLIGRENYLSLTIQSICQDQFAVAELYHKHANLCSELPAEKILDTGAFKDLSGNDVITSQRKFVQQRLQFKNYAKLVFSGNTLPETKDNSDAFARRATVISFPNEFTGNPDINLLAKLTSPDEMSGLLNICLELLPKLLAEGKFPHQKSLDESRKAYAKNSSSSEAFLAECIEDDSTGFIPTEDIIAAYRQFCKTRNLTVQSDKKVISSLRTSFPAMPSRREIEGIRKMGYNGIKLTQEFDNSVITVKQQKIN